MSRPLLRRLATVLSPAALVAAVLLSGCGGGNQQDVRDLVDTAFKQSIGSAKLSLDLRVTLNGIQSVKGPIKLSVSGPYVSGGKRHIPKVDWDLAVTASGQNYSLGLISTGDDAWVMFQGTPYELGRATVARLNGQLQQSARQQKGLSAFGIDPRGWIVDAKDEGTSKVAGVDTRHVSGKIDVGRLLDDLNRLVQRAGGSVGASAAQLTSSQKKEIQDAVESPRFDLYVGAHDDKIRRLAGDLSFKVPSNRRRQFKGLTSGSVSFSIEFADVGSPQTITAPRNAHPISELTSKLGVPGASSAPGVTAPSIGGANAQKFGAYSKCLEQANPGDARALQRCAQLLK